MSDQQANPPAIAVYTGGARTLQAGTYTPLTVDSSGALLTTGGGSSPTPTVPVTAATISTTNVSAAVADTQILAANSSRVGWTVYNDTSTGILYLKLGTGASATSNFIEVQPGTYYEPPSSWRWLGVINGFWSVADGTARVMEASS